jgi:Cof subfamily protein (haloacid dehalogenase superfamily)
MLRLLATDLDGTLLRTDGTVSERTRRALDAAIAAGVAVVLVTGRPPHTLKQAAHAAGLTGLAVCSNGAIVYDLDRDEIVRHTPLPVEATRGVILTLRAAVPDVCFAFVRGTRFACEPAYHSIASAADHADGFLDLAVLGDAITLADEAPTKLIARHATINPDDLLTQMLGLALAGVEVTHSGAPYVELSASGVTKAFALEAFCADLGISANEVVAFGDAPNDLPMLRWAGHGIAVANAHPTVLVEADEVAPANDDDGVAIVLERLLRMRQDSKSGA